MSIVTSIAIREFITRALLEGNPFIILFKEKLWQGQAFHHITTVRRYLIENTGDLHDLHVVPLPAT